MPWLGKMPAASTSEGVGDRVRGVRSAVAILLCTDQQHWATGGNNEVRSNGRGKHVETIYEIFTARR